MVCVALQYCVSPLRYQWRKTDLKRGLMLGGIDTLEIKIPSMYTADSLESVTPSMSVKRKLEVFCVWSVACIRTLLFDIHISPGGKRAGKEPLISTL